MNLKQLLRRLKGLKDEMPLAKACEEYNMDIRDAMKTYYS